VPWRRQPDACQCGCDNCSGDDDSNTPHNVTHQRPRATAARNDTEGSSRGSLNAPCWVPLSFLDPLATWPGGRRNTSEPLGKEGFAHDVIQSLSQTNSRTVTLYSPRSWSIGGRECECLTLPGSEPCAAEWAWLVSNRIFGLVLALDAIKAPF
jgi:hypothetical protein